MMPREPDETKGVESEENSIEVGDVEALKQALAEEKAKAEANLASWQRTQADFINYKRRSEQEREEIGKFASANLTLSLLPVLDDLERALAAIPPELTEVPWVVDGIRMIERKLRATLESQGLSQIDVVGQPYDPNLHEAATYGKGKEGLVVAEVRKGYRFQDRIIRPAMVIVGNGEEEIKEE